MQYVSVDLCEILSGTLLYNVSSNLIISDTFIYPKRELLQKLGFVEK